MSIELWLVSIFIGKHFIADFPLQTPFMYKNKGTYGHIGGIAHALVHGSFTFLSLIAAVMLLDLDITPMQAVVAFWIDAVVHYHMDWFKVRMTKAGLRNGHWVNGYAYTDEWGKLVVTSNRFFIWLGIDQLVHYLTYVGIVWWIE